MTTRVYARGADVRRYVLENIGRYPRDISNRTMRHFRISRQAVNKHLHKLVGEGALEPVGSGQRIREYKLRALLEWRGTYPIQPGTAEHEIWLTEVRPVLGKLPENVLEIWSVCVTEILNNAIDHSGGTMIRIQVMKTAANTQILIGDNGIGIFKKIKAAFNLLDERHALLELSKGKLTTDRDRHSGQGIFFTSRMLESFDILSGGVYYSHVFGEDEDWILESVGEEVPGTTVYMKLNNHTSRTAKQIYDEYSALEDGDPRFIRTVVPVRLAQYGSDSLVSRSQAKMVLARIEEFKVVIFDFVGVNTIGQAFADEMFRVFPRTHPELELKVIRENARVRAMIDAARSGQLEGSPEQFRLKLVGP